MNKFHQCKSIAEGVSTYAEHEAAKKGIRLTRKAIDKIRAAAMGALLAATKGGAR